MTKRNKMMVGILAAVVGVVVLTYLFLGLVSSKPGMNGFTVTNGMICMLLTGDDYKEVGEDRYLYRAGNLKQIIENEYASYTFIDNIYDKEPELLKTSLVIKDSQKLKGSGHSVWSLPGALLRFCDRHGIRYGEFYAVYYKPYEPAE